MISITRSADCGNSPKNQLVEDVSVALATAHADTLADQLIDEVRWEIVGGPTLTGRAEVTEAIPRHLRETPTSVTIERVVTHGRGGAVSGRITFAKGAQEFCDVYEFSSARGTHIKSIKSYRIDTA